MSEVWNLWDLNPPPICSVKTELHIKEINALKVITFDALKTVKNLCDLDQEAAVLSRFLYKHKRVFRHDKGMQNLVKINQSLRRYLKLDLLGVLLTFQASLPHNLMASVTHAYLPTRQMLKWVLLRLQAFSQLFARILRLTKETGAYIYQKICLGWSLNLSFLIFSMTARFFVLSKFLVMKSIEWYSAFYRSLSFLKETANFLPLYTFPVDLKQWLEPLDLTSFKKKSWVDNVFKRIDIAGEDENDEIADVKIMNEKFIESIFKMKVKIDTAPEEIIIEEEEEEREEKEGKGVKRCLQSSLSEELGVPVVNEEDISERPRKKLKKKNWKVFKDFKNLVQESDKNS